MLGDDDFRPALVEVGDDQVGVEGLIGDQPAKLDPFERRRDADVSKRCRGSRAKRSRFQAHRSRPGPWSFGRPSACLWPGPKSPHCALPMAANPDDGDVDHGVFRVGFIRYGIENPF